MTKCLLFHDWVKWEDIKGGTELFKLFGYYNQQIKTCARCGRKKVRYV
jgi:hypothetical protein